MKFVKVGKSGSGFCYAKNCFLQSRNVIFILDCKIMMMSQTPYDTHSKVVISRAKFDAHTFSSFGGVKTHRQNRAL